MSKFSPKYQTGQARGSHELHKLEEKYSAHAQPRMFFRLNRISLKKNGTFDLATTIHYVNNTLTFFNCFHKYQLIKAMKPAEPIFLTSTLMRAALLL